MSDAVPADQIDATPRADPECVKCPTGEYEYVEQTTTARGDLASPFRCGDCGHEVIERRVSVVSVGFEAESE